MHNQNISFDVLLEKVKSYIKAEKEIKLIEKAYNYANVKHHGQKRKTGEDYIIHPLSVAYILTDIYADSSTICAALLHDVVEDSDATLEELTKEFSKEIVELVDGVTKINKLNFSGETENVLANHRKILVGLSKDVRVIILKLADRLHNLRTLWVLPEKKQKEKAKETLDILTPIAHRLGMSNIKSELEDLSLRYYKPDVYFSIVEQLNQSKNERYKVLNTMIENVSSVLKEHNIKHEIKGRAKSIYSIFKKLNQGRKFSDIYDLLALRVFVDTESDCYQALGIIHSKYRPVPKRFKDYIAMPKTNMYQSLHTTVFGAQGNLFEIQIRTYEMDKIAEYGIASHWSYKEKTSGTIQDAMEQKLQFFRSIMELQNESSPDEDFVNSIKEDLFKENVYVFTPKGDVIELPTGSTPIDFAYKVHSAIGDKMVGAIVNNNIVPLDYKLKDNDIIRINTNPSSVGPNREWINIVKTSQARNKIKSFFHKIDKENLIKKGEETLNKELKKRKITLSEFYSKENFDNVLSSLKCRTPEELYLSISTNRIPITTVINTYLGDTEKKEELILKKTQNKEVKPVINKNDIIIDGIDEIKVNIAACCKPVPGDRIVGYITKGYGITIHRMVCPNVSDLEERIIDVKWNEKTNNRYSTSVLVHAENNTNILMDIVSKTSGSDITVQSIITISTEENYLYEIIILVNNKEKLIKFINDINSIPNILDVERAIK